MTSPPSGSTIGLSLTLFISIASTPLAYASASRVAPCTCGAHRSEYASCTRCARLPVGGEDRRDAESSRRRFAALAACPGCGRSACSRSSKGRSVPSDASIVIAATTSAVRASDAARSVARMPIASMPCVPFTRASPSFASSISGESPARAIAAGAGSAPPSGASTSPWPISGRARFASGARSPDAPSDPCWGTAGITSSFSIETIRSTTSGRTPECPRASTWARSRSIARASSRGRGVPTAVACDRTMPCCSVEACAGSTRVWASAPNPVVTP